MKKIHFLFLVFINYDTIVAKGEVLKWKKDILMNIVNI